VHAANAGSLDVEFAWEIPIPETPAGCKSMPRWFLSYNSADGTEAERLEAGLKAKEPETQVFFAPKALRAGGYWQPVLAQEIAAATAFVLLVGEKGLGQWQEIEYYEALDKRVKSPGFLVVLVLREGQPAPGLPFIRQLHWIVTADPACEQAVAQLADAAAGAGTRPGELWRHTSPYRGLAAMTEADSDFFFGRQPQVRCWTPWRLTRTGYPCCSATPAWENPR
jgi:hypothetical protein